MDPKSKNIPPNTTIENQLPNETINQMPSWDTLIVEGLEEALFSLDKSWHFTYVNERAAAELGRSKESLLGKNIWEEFPEIIGSNYEKLYRNSVESNKPDLLEEYSSSAKAWFEVRAYPIPQGLIVYFQTITVRKQLEQALYESEARYKALSEGSSEGVIIYQNEVVTEANETAAQLYGYTNPLDLSGISFKALVDPECLGLLQAQIGRGDEGFFEFTGVRKDNSRFPIEGCFKAIKYRGQPAWVGVVRDITERKLSTEAFARYTRRLEILHEIDTGIIESYSISEVIKVALKKIRQLIPCRLGGITLVDALTSEMIVFNSDSAYPREADDGVRLSIPDNWFDMFDGFDSRHIRIIENLQDVKDLHPRYQQFIEEGLVSAMQVLLVSKEGPIGLFALLADSSNFFTTEYQEAASQIGSQLTIALQQLHLSQQAANHAAELERMVISLKKAQEEARQSEILYRSVVDDQTDLICRYDTDYKLTFVNLSYCQAVGKTAQELLGTSFLARIPQEDLERAMAHPKALTRDNPVAISEHHAIMSGTEPRWYEWTDRAIIGEDGSVIEYQGVGRDITDRKNLQAEQARSTLAIEEMRQFLQTTLDVLPSYIAVLEPDGTISSVNAAWKQLGMVSGSDTSSIDIGVNYLTICDIPNGPFGEAAPNALNGICAVISGQANDYYLEYFCHGKTADRWFSMRVTPFNEPAPRRVVVSHLEITERKKTEEALRQSEEKYRSLVESSEASISMLDYEGQYLYLNAIAATPYKMSPERMVGMSVFELFPPEVAKQILGDVQKVISQDTGMLLEPEVVVAGKLCWYRTSIQPVRGSTGKPIAALIYATEITDKKMAEAALQKANVTLELRVLERTAELERLKNRLEAIFNNSGDGIVLLDLEHGIQQSNPAFDKLFGSLPEAAIGLPLTALVHPDNIAELNEVINAVAQTHAAQQIELQALSQAGTTFEAEISISPVNFSDKVVTNLVCIVRDVSERKRNQQMIAEERNLLRTLIDAVPDFIYVKDTQHRLLLNNIAHARSLAADTPEQVLGKTDFDLFPSELATKFYADEVELFRTGQPILNIEERSLGEDGSNIWALTTKVPLRNLNGEVIGLVGITHDISKIKKQEEVLQRNQADLETIIESTSLAFMLFDLEGTIRVVNKLAQTYNQKQYGKPVRVGESILDYIPADWRINLLARFDKVKAGESLVFVESINMGEEPQYIEFRYYPVKTANGEVVGISVTFEDITARKETELQLRFLASLQEHMLDAVSATDVNLNITSWNKAAENIYGWTAEEAIGRNVVELIPSRLASGESIDEAVGVLLEKGFWSGEVTQQRRDGSDVTLLASMVLFRDAEGNHAGMVGVSHDITFRKQAEAILQENREREQELQKYLKVLHEISVELTSISKLDEFYKRVVELGLERLGFERIGLLVYDPVQDLALGTYGTDSQGKLIPEQHIRLNPAHLTGILKRAMRTPQQYIFEENAQLYADGQYIGQGWNAAVGLWQGTKLLGWLAIDNAVQHKGITRNNLEVLSLYRTTVAALLANKLVEEKLQSTTQRLELATQSGNIGIWEWNLLDNSLDFDDRMLSLYGTNRDKFKGNTDSWKKMVHPDDFELVQKVIANAIKYRTPCSAEFRVIWPDQSLHYIRAHALVQYNKEGRGVRMFGANVDVTNYKRSEEVLQKALAKEKELGELKTRFVSRASHEFRTPLAAILATTESLTIYRPRMTDVQIDARLERIRQQVGYMKGIMEDVLQLSRLQSGKSQFTPTREDMDMLCRIIINEFESQEENKNRITYSCAETPLIGQFDLRLIRQVISNLISNALKYSPPEKTVRLELTSDSTQVILKVQDEGIGIPPEDIKSLFEPFQRGRNVGSISGTGLGLSIALQAVEMHGGTILVESEVEVGSTFTLIIPKDQANRKETD